MIGGVVVGALLGDRLPVAPYGDGVSAGGAAAAKVSGSADALAQVQSAFVGEMSCLSRPVRGVGAAGAVGAAGPLAGAGRRTCRHGGAR